MKMQKPTWGADKGILRLLIACSGAIALVSTFSDVGICYACDFELSLILLGLHLVLFAATFVEDKLLSALVLTMLVFYVSRVGILQFNQTLYTYPYHLPSSVEMGEVLKILLFITISLLTGCMAGTVIAGRKVVRNYKITLFSPRPKEENSFYVYMLWIYIIGKLVALYIFAIGGVGIGIDLKQVDPFLLRIAKFIGFFNFIEAIFIGYTVLAKLQGYEKKLTVFAIVLFTVMNFTTGSKVALVYSILPFFFVYYVVGKKIPSRLMFYLLSAAALTVVVLASIQAWTRTYVEATLTGAQVEYLDFSKYDFVLSVLGFAARVGSSFDVLCLVVTQRPQFAVSANLLDEFIGVINSYVPGGLIAVDVASWAQMMYSIGHGGDYEQLRLMQTGENITLPGHLFFNFEMWAVCFVSFFLMCCYAYIYRRTNVIFIKMSILSTIVFGISNGSGLVSFVLGLPTVIVYYSVLYYSHRIAFRLLRLRLGSYPPSIPNSSHRHINAAPR